MNVLKIGELVANKPIIQGGMGVGVSLSNLAGAVAAEGGIGVISAAQIGFLDECFENNPLKANLEALSRHISIAREKAKDGIIGVNVMVALKHYEEYIRCCVENKVDLIISGAGLPLNLPALVKGSATKIAPIISSVKAASVLSGIWDKRYEAAADAVVIEGPKAGGHLGFKPEQLGEDASENLYDKEVKKIIDFVKSSMEKFNRHIPVIFAGGIFEKEDAQHYLDIGCDGVQVSSRFVATQECDAHHNFKQAYVDVKENEIGVVKSPVGMPGRAIINSFITRTQATKEPITRCYDCLTNCDPRNIPYCITKALINAAKGDVENGLVFCGKEAYRINRIETVKDVLHALTPG